MNLVGELLISKSRLETLEAFKDEGKEDDNYYRRKYNFKIYGRSNAGHINTSS
ncbi:MAG: hypothetical protein CI948_840 [Halanaerobium sp.]|jgi:hypothetical protein|nr:MAG: hypothetical protein CI948_840 [Halanaerobium sp.]